MSDDRSRRDMRGEVWAEFVQKVETLTEATCAVERVDSEMIEVKIPGTTKLDLGTLRTLAELDIEYARRASIGLINLYWGDHLVADFEF